MNKSAQLNHPLPLPLGCDQEASSGGGTGRATERKERERESERKRDNPWFNDIFTNFFTMTFYTEGRRRPSLRGRGRSQLIYEGGGWGEDCFPPSPLPAPLSLTVLYDEGTDKYIIKMVVTFPSPFPSAPSLSLCTMSR